nr:MAG TPA: Protein of unknown function (DUF2635) [Caudoviricetes sp.]
MKQVLVKPKAGVVVPDINRHDELPEQGRLVTWSVYWARRLRDGDIEVVETKRKTKTTKEK